MNTHLETKALFAGYNPADNHGAVKPPMHPTSTFVFPSAAVGAAHMETAYGVEGAETPPEGGFIYSRLGNPTLSVAENRLAAWDESDAAAFFASGMAAISTMLFALTGPDKPLWYVGPLYGGTQHIVDDILPSMGVSFKSMESLDDLSSITEADGLPGMIYLETPANPTLQIHSIKAAADWAKNNSSEDHRIIVAVDNTFLGPIIQRPLELGADLNVYSATKYIGGHSDLIAGAVSGEATAMAKVFEYRTFFGGMADPYTSWMLSRSMETLQVRVARQISSARLILDHIQEAPGTPVSGINKIYSAWAEDLEGSGDIRSAEIAKEQQANGGAMFALELPGGRQAAFAFLDALKHIQLAVSLGSTESLAEHPASMTHAGVSVEEKLKHGITEGLVRISIGLEHPEDLIADINQALQAACKVYEETLECV
ncbi:PLP-dependent transferase [Flavobacteriales bacterium]|jgi:methionine-gamma-lyase|nr:PLP-dependent transferase [Flavobacteriales bacterium]